MEDLIDRSKLEYKKLKKSGRPIRDFNFKGTPGWVRGFLGRYELSSRMATSVGQKVPINAKDLIEDLFGKN